MFKASEEMLNVLRPLPTKQLLEIWQRTEEMIGSAENILARDALMTVFEERNPALFDKWMCNDYNKNPAGDNPEYWYKKKVIKGGARHGKIRTCKTEKSCIIYEN